MRLKNINLYFISFLILTSCSTTKSSIYWVNSAKVDCMGVGPMKCLLVQKAKTIEENNWQNFYSVIEGFDFEAGYIYKLKVKEEKLPLDQVPADASSVKYTLIKELEKQIDNKVLINGRWLLILINNASINRTFVLPTLFISINKMRISGSGGCNNYSGTIKELTQKTVLLGNVISTKKACFNKNIEADYLNTLNLVKTYRVEGNKLVFYGTKGEKLLSFLKLKEQVANQRLQDIWIATRINGNPIEDMNPTPRMEINLTKMRVLGTDGCNNYSGVIKKASGLNLEFGNLASTRKICLKMDIANAFNKAMNKVSSYKLDGLNLTLFDNDGKEILSFLKGD